MFKEEISEKNQNKPNTTLLTKDNYGAWQASFRIPCLPLTTCCKVINLDDLSSYVKTVTALL